MFTRRCVVAAAVVFMCLVGLGAQAPQDDESVWKAFMTWFKTSPPAPGNPVGGLRGGAAEARGRRRGSQAPGRRADAENHGGRSDWVEPFYDGRSVETADRRSGDRRLHRRRRARIVIEAVKGAARRERHSTPAWGRGGMPCTWPGRAGR